MTEQFSLQFFKDILNEVPEMSILSVFTNEIGIVTNYFKESKIEYKTIDNCYCLTLSEEVKRKLLSLAKNKKIHDYFMHLYVDYKEQPQLKIYDHLEYGEISKNFLVSERFKNEYVNKQYCVTSKSF